MAIKKGCIARCKAGMLGLVTSDSPQMTRYGKMAWIGIQLSPDKAGGEWCSQDPEFVYNSIDYLLEDFKLYEKEDWDNEDFLYKACVEKGLIDEAIEESLCKAGADMVYGTSELIRFLVNNTGPFYKGETK